MKPLFEMKDHKQRFIRSFLLAVVFIAVGTALGYCQAIEIKGEVHRDVAPSNRQVVSPIIPVSPTLDDPSDSIFLTPEEEAQLLIKKPTPAKSLVEPTAPQTKSRSSKYVSTTETSNRVSNGSSSVLDLNTSQPNQSVNQSNVGNEKEGWKSFYSDAVKESIEKKRPIMLLFTGSDWCPTCRRLDMEILRTKTFADWSRENVIKVELNFPRTYRLPQELAQQNMQLQKQYAPYLATGFPAALFVDSTGKVLGKARYTTAGVDAWIKQTKSAFAPQPVNEKAQDIPIGKSLSSDDYGKSILD